ncbi:MAG: hypothetical protein OIF58_02040 [Cohaesibacter sp.]|nr:hypothetical protein [Cohaesibacter sp.]
MTKDIMFVEGIRLAALANGVLRIECLYSSANGEEQVSGELLIPANRVGNVIQGLSSAAASIAQKQQEAIEAQSSSEKSDEQEDIALPDVL